MSNVPVLLSDGLARCDEILRDAGRIPKTIRRGYFMHRRTEADYMGVLLDAVPLEDWREVVRATVAAAKDGDATARAWLGTIPYW